MILAITNRKKFHRDLFKAFPMDGCYRLHVLHKSACLTYDEGYFSLGTLCLFSLPLFLLTCGLLFSCDFPLPSFFCLYFGFKTLDFGHQCIIYAHFCAFTILLLFVLHLGPFLINS